MTAFVSSSSFNSLAAPPALRAEALLLLYSVRRLWDESSQKQINEMLTSRIDWDYLIRTASRHDIRPWVYIALREAKKSVPDAIQCCLRQNYLQDVAHSMMLTAELKRVLEVLEANATRVLPMKGPVLSALLYGDPAFRPTVDLDLLVHKDDLLKAAKVLQQAGYVLQESYDALEDMRYRGRDCEWHFISESTRVLVEMHWEIIPQQRFCSDFLWGRTVPTSFLGVRTLGLPLEELFFLLCVHGGTKHQWGVVKWIADIALLAATKTLNWSYLLGLARKHGQERSIMVGLCLIHRLFALNLPADLVRCIYKNPLHGGVVGLVQGRLFREDSSLPGWREWLQYVADPPPRSNRRNRYHFQLQEYWLYLRVIMIPEFADCYEMRLPRNLSFLRYAYRPLRLLRRHGWKLIRRLK